MKSTILGICILILAAGTALHAQDSDAALNPAQNRPFNEGTILTPRSSMPSAENADTVARTHFKIFVPAGRPEGVVGFSEAEANAVPKQPSGINGPIGETPASLACLYGLVPWPKTGGCDPVTFNQVASGGSKAIAIVVAYDYPTAVADLTAYSKYWGLPAPKITVTWPSAKPPVDPMCAYGGWSCWAATSAQEIEIAHAMAPKAQIILVEAATTGYYDLYAAVKTAKKAVEAAGGGEISMSWGISESSIETFGDSLFTDSKAHVVFFASTGGGVEYPAASPNVVAVGGTTISRNPSSLIFQGEVAWEEGGGGNSAFEVTPAFQTGIKLVGTSRGTPDVAALGNPRTGIWIYDSYGNSYGGTLYPWIVFGGTGGAAPLVAGIVNSAGHFIDGSANELALIYANTKVPANIYDINDGTCGYYDGYLAKAGWDACSGVGSPLGLAGK